LEEPELLLKDLGYDPFFHKHFENIAADGQIPGRISFDSRNIYTVITEAGEMTAIPTGRMHYDAVDDGLPVVGDWVVVSVLDENPPRALIHAILPRRSVFSRKEAGKRVVEQPVAANIDTAFVVVGLDHNFNLRRIERYLTVVWQSGANPVVVLSKSDLCDDIDGRLAQANAAAPGVPVHTVSAPTGYGFDAINSYLLPGHTVALLGSSGVGKSTIINYLLGKDVQKVKDVREDDSRGRHTTTHRQMFLLPGGGLVVDTPGMRELQLWNADDGLTDAFTDIQSLAAGCRFTDCSHSNEPGCKVQEALETGGLDPSRFENYRKMQSELAYLARKQDYFAAQKEKLKWKRIFKEFRKTNKKK